MERHLGAFGAPRSSFASFSGFWNSFALVVGLVKSNIIPTIPSSLSHYSFPNENESLQKVNSCGKLVCIDHGSSNIYLHLLASSTWFHLAFQRAA